MLTNEKISFYWSLALIFCLVSAFMFMPDLASASSSSSAPTTGTTGTDTNNPIACVLYRIQNSLTGAIGKGIATVAIVALGIGLFLGKLSWGLAIATSVGVGLIFGANEMVSWLAGSSAISSASCATS